jgi:hypothetical protein
MPTTLPGALPEDAPDAWLARDPLPEDPVAIVKAWLDDAFAKREQRH